jgi:hypothetical protein
MLSVAFDTEIASDPRFGELDQSAQLGMKKLFLEDAFKAEKAFEVEQAPERRGFIGRMGSALGRGVVSTIGKVGQALELADLTPREIDTETGALDTVGRAITDFSQRVQKEYQFLKQDKGELLGEPGFFERGVVGIPENIPQSLPVMGTAWVGAKLGAAAGTPFGPAGAATGAVIGGIGGAVAGLVTTFGAGQYGESYTSAYQELKRTRPEATEEEVREVAGRLAFREAALEVGTELPGTLLGLRMLGGTKVLTQPFKATLRNVLVKPRAEFAKEFAATTAGEVGGEMVAGGGQAWARQTEGLSGPTISEGVAESIIPSLGMSLFFGGAAAGYNSVQTRSMMNKLNSENIDERKFAADTMAYRLSENTQDKALALVWRQEAEKTIDAGEKFSFDEKVVDFAKIKAAEDFKSPETETFSADEYAKINAAPDLRTAIERFNSILGQQITAAPREDIGLTLPELSELPQEKAIKIFKEEPRVELFKGQQIDYETKKGQQRAILVDRYEDGTWAAKSLKDGSTFIAKPEGAKPAPILERGRQVEYPTTRGTLKATLLEPLGDRAWKAIGENGQPITAKIEKIKPIPLAGEILPEARRAGTIRSDERFLLPETPGTVAQGEQAGALRGSQETTLRPGTNAGSQNIQPPASGQPSRQVRLADLQAEMDQIGEIDPTSSKHGELLIRQKEIAYEVIQAIEKGDKILDQNGDLYGKVESISRNNVVLSHPEQEETFSVPIKDLTNDFIPVAGARMSVEAVHPVTAQIDALAHEAATSTKNDKVATPDNLRAGNYAHGHIRGDIVGFPGRKISVETPRGEMRSEAKPENAPEGWKPKWTTEMKGGHYGYWVATNPAYAEGTKGPDIDVFTGKPDKVDVMIGEDPTSEKVFVVDQIDPKTKKFDEPKTLIHYPDIESAKAAYLSSYEPGWQGLGAITEMSKPEFDAWFGDGKRKTEPVSYGKAEGPASGATGEQISTRTGVVDTKLSAPEGGELPSIEWKSKKVAGMMVETTPLGKDSVVVQELPIKGKKFVVFKKSDGMAKNIGKFATLAEAKSAAETIIPPAPLSQTEGTPGATAENAGGFSIGPIEKAIKKYGTTTIPESASFIAPDGRIIDSSGKTLGSKSEGPNIDHREIAAHAVAGKESISGGEALNKFMAKTGSVRVRVSGDELNVHSVEAPTVPQLIALRNLSVGKKIFADIQDRAGQTIASGEFKSFPEYRKFLDSNAIRPAEMTMGDFGPEVESETRAAVQDILKRIDEQGLAVSVSYDPEATHSSGRKIRFDLNNPADVRFLIHDYGFTKERIDEYRRNNVPVGIYGVYSTNRSVGPGYRGKIIFYKGATAADVYEEYVHALQAAEIAPAGTAPAGISQIAHEEAHAKKIVKDFLAGKEFPGKETKYVGKRSVSEGSTGAGKVSGETSPATRKRSIRESFSARERQHAFAESPIGSKVTAPAVNYNRGIGSKGNVWIRQSDAESNEGRQLLMQFSTELINKNAAVDSSTEYYDALYSGQREGYQRLRDFWEIPQWMGYVSNYLPNADVYVVRDMAEAKQFLDAAGYNRIVFSAIDVNKDMIKEISRSFDGHVDIGGYTTPGTFDDIPNATFHETLQSLAGDIEVEFKEGVDYRHFEGSKVIPRLTMSQGCLHKCAFCTVPKSVVATSNEVVDQQTEAFGVLDAKLVYLNDKTFGQAKNYTYLENVYQAMLKNNPGFKGFIIQTTGTQLLKMDKAWLKRSGIKYVELGVETYNNAILKDLHKPHNEAILDKAAQKLREADIALIPNIIVGLPGETAGTYARTLDFIERNSDIISHENIYNLALYEGAELAKSFKVTSAADLDENVVEKSFHTDHLIHAEFSEALFNKGQHGLGARRFSVHRSNLSSLEETPPMGREFEGLKESAPTPPNHAEIMARVKDPPWMWTAAKLVETKLGDIEKKLDRIWGPESEFDEWRDGGGEDLKRHYVAADLAADLDQAVHERDIEATRAILKEIRSRLKPQDYFAYSEAARGETENLFAIRKESKRSLGARVLAGIEKPNQKIGPLVTHIAAHLSSESAKEGVIDHRTATPREHKQVEKALADMLEASILKHPESVGWYKEDIRRTMSILKEIHPDLKNPSDNFWMRIAISLTSDGNKTMKNLELADLAYRSWKETGSIVSPIAAKRGETIFTNLQFAEDVRQAFGSDGEFETWLLGKAPAGEIASDLSIRLGIDWEDAKKLVAGEKLSSVVPRSVIFGPKLGAFFSNLSGDFSPVTMDMWFMRTMGRIQGNLMKGETPEEAKDSRSRLKAAMKDSPRGVRIAGIQPSLFGKYTDEDIDQIAKDISRKAGPGGEKFRKQLGAVRGGDELRNAANAREEILKGGTTKDAPQSGEHRQWLRDRVNATRESVNKKGYNYENADIQAAIWIGEKEIYNAYGSRPTQGDYFSDGANALYEKLHGRPSAKYAGGPGELAKRSKLGPETGSLFSIGPIISKIYETAQQNPEGFTIDVATGGSVIKGWAVAPSKQTETVTVLTPESIRDFVINKFGKVFESDKRAFFGGWQDKDEQSPNYGKFVMDVAFVLDNKEDAAYIADIGEQDGIFNIETLTYVRTEDAIRELKEAGVFNESRRAELGGIREQLHRSMQESRASAGERFAARQVSEGNGREGSLSGVGLHYSRENLTELNTAFAGTGFRGNEYRRIISGTPNAKRAYIYIHEGNGIRKETGIAGTAYKVPFSNFYEADYDPLRIIPTVKTLNEFEQAVMDRGFDGIVLRDQGMAVFLGDHSILVEKTTEADIPAVEPYNASGVFSDFYFAIHETLKNSPAPVEDVSPVLMKIDRPISQILSEATRLYQSWGKEAAADGRIFNPQNPEEGSHGKRVWHLLSNTQDNSFDREKGKWFPNIIETVKNASRVIEDDRNKNHIYVRAYKDGMRHMVVVDKDGNISDQTKLITQFPNKPTGKQTAQDRMKIVWERETSLPAEGAPGAAALNAGSQRFQASETTLPETEIGVKENFFEHTPGTLENPDIRYAIEPVVFADSLKPISGKDYEENRAQLTASPFSSAFKQAKTDMGHEVSRIFAPVSTRLKLINPKLSEKVRSLDYSTLKNIQKYAGMVEPLLKKAKTMTRPDAMDWDYARKNSDVPKINELVKKYGMEKEYAEARKMFDELRDEAIDVGLDIREIEGYWTRKVKDYKGLLGEMNREEMGIFTKILSEKAAKMGIQIEDLDPDMRATLISNIISGGPTGLGVSATKSRVFQKIPPRLNRYYLNSDAAVLEHISSMVQAIEKRKFFGKIPEKVAEMRRQKYAAQAKVREYEEKMKTDPRAQWKRDNWAGEVQLLEAAIQKYALQRDFTDNIGAYIDELIVGGEIKPSEENDVAEILNARFHEKGPKGFWQLYKNFSYMDTMGSPISALTQIGDLAWAMYENGMISGLKNAYKSAIGQSKITREDAGISRIAEEFADQSKLGGAVAWVFKHTGLEKMDAIGKEALINSALERYQAKNPEDLKKEIQHIMGEETDNTVYALKNDIIDDNVKRLIYSRLADFQPVGMSEMPQGYLTAGNGRIFYMLKTFTLKQFDVFRNEAIHKISSGTRAEKIDGLKNLIKLTMFFVLANATADELKDFILGRKTDFSDRVADNVLRLAGASKFITWTARTEGVGSTLAKQILPPFKFIDSLTKDVYNAGDDKGMELTSSIPLVGKLAYWHLGRGTTKRKDLWEQRLTKYRQKVSDVHEDYERAKDKPTFTREHKKELAEYRKLTQFQGRINSLRKISNQLKSREQTDSIKKRIEQIESRRIEMIKQFLQ